MKSVLFGVVVLAAGVAGAGHGTEFNARLDEVKAKAAALVALSEEGRRAKLEETVRTVCDLELMPPEIDMHPDPEKFSMAKQRFALNGGMAKTKGGRLWSVWVGGEDGPKGFNLGSWSDDDGKSWKDPGFRVGSPEPVISIGSVGLYITHLIPNLWYAPDGSLRLYVSQSVNMFDQRTVTFEFICRDPDAEVPRWEEPKLITLGSIHNKGLVAKDGTWYLPNDLEDVAFIRTDVFPEIANVRGCGLLASTDNGASWVFRGNTRPDGERHYCEHSAVELADGGFRIFMRTGKGLMESVTQDGGRSWTKPTSVAGLRQPVARFGYMRLKSGNLLFVKNGRDPDRLAKTKSGDRAELTAFLSEDDGKTWIGGLVIDERERVAYPDVFQDDDGWIYVSYDHDRGLRTNELLFAKFREEDVRAGRISSSGASVRSVVKSAR